MLKLFASRGIYWSIPCTKPTVFLTFDDGPDARVTPEVLSILKDFDARATFFCLGSQVEKNPTIFDQIIHQGHAIGNHTYSHPNAWRKNRTEFLKDVEKCEHIFSSSLMRPPYGNLPLSGLNELRHKYKIIMWSLMSYDFDPRVAPDTIIKVMIKYTSPGSIWVFHDNTMAKSHCLSVLPRLIEWFMENDFVFDRIDSSKL